MRDSGGFLFAYGLAALALIGCGDTNVTVYCDGGGTGGTQIESVVCQGSLCPCTEDGVRAAIAAGGGPYAFACGAPTTVETQSEIVIDNDVILDGAGELTLDGRDSHLVLSVASGVNAQLRGFVVTRGLETGILNAGTLAISDSTVSESGGGFGGGGVLNARGAAMSITNSTISGNSAYDGGGGIANDKTATMTITNTTVSGNTASEGGGVHNWGTLTMTGVLIAGNSVSPGGSLGEGGGIANWGTLVLTNSTVSGNASTAGGGGIFNTDDGGAGTLTSINTTVSGNSADSGAAGMFTMGGSVTLTSTIVDGDCDGGVASRGYNIESPADTCGFDEVGDQAGVNADDLKLGQLQDNGGLTETLALGDGSVAIDQVPEFACIDADSQLLKTDQRGEPRPAGVDAECDVGSFEVQGGGM